MHLQSQSYCQSCDSQRLSCYCFDLTATRCFSLYCLTECCYFWSARVSCGVNPPDWCWSLRLPKFAESLKWPSTWYRVVQVWLSSLEYRADCWALAIDGDGDPQGSTFWFAARSSLARWRQRRVTARSGSLSKSYLLHDCLQSSVYQCSRVFSSR